jgi:hypothetical protein
MFKVHNTESSDFKIGWNASNNAATPNLSMNSPDFHYTSGLGQPTNLGLQANSDGWYSYTLTLTRDQNSAAFKTHFWFRFESSLNWDEQVWVDNAIITVE